MASRAKAYILIHGFWRICRHVAISVDRYADMSICLSVCPSVCLSVCPSVCLSVCAPCACSVCRSCLCHVASREVWVQPSRDTVVLGNTNTIFFYVFRRCGEVSPQLGREVSGLTQRKPKSSLCSAGGHRGGRETTKSSQKWQGPGAHRGTPGGRGGRGGQPAGESPGTLQKNRKS